MSPEEVLSTPSGELGRKLAEEALERERQAKREQRRKAYEAEQLAALDDVERYTQPVRTVRSSAGSPARSARPSPARGLARDMQIIEACSAAAGELVARSRNEVEQEIAGLKDQIESLKRELASAKPLRSVA